MPIELIFILLLVVANGVFAMSEIAVISARKARLQQWAEGGDARAQIALTMANAPDRFLSTVQIGITLVGIFAGAFGGATVAEKLALLLNNIPWLAPYSTVISVTLVVVLITYLSLVIGELVPKRIGLANAERIACTVAPFMNTLAWVAAPLVNFLSLSSDLLLRVIGVRATDEPTVTEEEVRILLRQGAEAGVFEQTEHQIVERVFRLNDHTAHTIMTPRREMLWFAIDDTWEEIRTKLTLSPYSYFPVAKGGLDQVIGMVHAKALLEQSLKGAALDLRLLMIPPLFLPDSMSVLEILERFRETRSQAALVIDEYGGLEGMIQLLDIVEGIVGDLPQVGELVESEAVQREDGSWLLGGRLLVEQFKTLLDIKTLPDEEMIGYQTLGGFVMAFLESVPTTGDKFQWANWQFEVVDMDGNRVDKLLVTPLTSENVSTETS